MSGYRQLDVFEQLARRIQSLSVAELAELARLQADEDIVGLKEAAAILKVSPEALRVKAKAWGVPHKRVGTEWRFSRRVLHEWVQVGEQAA